MSASDSPADQRPPRSVFAGGASSGEIALAAAALLLVLAVWIEPGGSSLAEPDEPRYAEIPREMLATGDFVVPRLNGVPYFEKPPLLYWSNAAAFRVFGESAWSARLPTRLAGLGTLLLVVWSVARSSRREMGLAAGVLFLTAPLAFALSRLNLTDGLLTFFFTATLAAARETLRRREAGRPSSALSALTGALAAGAFLTKGLVGIVLPGAILVAWCLWTRRARRLSALLLGPAVPVFLALAAPWLWAAERRVPGFLDFFLVHEHFARFATSSAHRPGSIFYFLGVFVAGFLPALAFFFRGLARVGRRYPDELFFLLWFAIVLGFFSVSRSKLVPYLFPAFPAAAALAARGFELAGRRRAPWIASAAVATILVAALFMVRAAREAVAVERSVVVLGGGALLVVAGSWLAVLFAARPSAALSCSGAGWGAFYVALALAYPTTATARDLPDLARAAARSAGASGGEIVTYQSYVQTLPWELARVVPLADHTGELESWFLPEPERSRIFWSRDRFWKEWSARPLVVVTRTSDLGQFENATPPAKLVDRRGKYALLTNTGR